MTAASICNQPHGRCCGLSTITTYTTLHLSKRPPSTPASRSVISQSHGLEQAQEPGLDFHGQPWVALARGDSQGEFPEPLTCPRKRLLFLAKQGFEIRPDMEKIRTNTTEFFRLFMVPGMFHFGGASPQVCLTRLRPCSHGSNPAPLPTRSWPVVSPAHCARIRRWHPTRDAAASTMQRTFPACNPRNSFGLETIWA
jgi:hypothetical protein